MAVPPLAAHQLARHAWTLHSPEVGHLWTGFRSVTLHLADYAMLLALLMGIFFSKARLKDSIRPHLH
jgi:hypothetical protein